MRFTCSCGREGLRSFSKFRRYPNCRRCGHEISASKKTLSYSSVKEELEGRGLKLLSTQYDGVDVPLQYVCTCGRTAWSSLSNIRQGCLCKGCLPDRTSGVKSPTFNQKMSTEERLKKRAFTEYRIWRRSVRERDAYMCVRCGSKSGGMCAHHLDGYEWCLDRRTDVTNGVTLCTQCHRAFHKAYGRLRNTKEQFYEWMSGGAARNDAA
ncbi:HNH endonuclease [Paenibacillus apii]|uniref:HNH endonuclease n=1 Tax=Paenibacillus apii TaxID=1850370 RepID=UPI0038B39E79